MRNTASYDSAKTPPSGFAGGVLGAASQTIWRCRAGQIGDCTRIYYYPFVSVMRYRIARTDVLVLLCIMAAVSSTVILNPTLREFNCRGKSTHPPSNRGSKNLKELLF